MPEHYSVLEPWAYEGIYRPCLAASSGRLNAWHFRRPAGSLSMEALVTRLRKGLKRKSTTEVRAALQRMKDAGAMGTIPGSGGNIPGMPDAWCSLYRVHQYREQQAAVTPAEVRQDLFGEQQERHKSREATELGADVPVAAMEDEPRLRDSSPEVDDIDLTQQLARANDPQQVDPAVPDAAGDDDSEDESDENLEAGVGRCKRILCGGGVLWTAHLAAAHDEDGALLLVFYAYLRGKRVKVLVDSGASDNFVSEESVEAPLVRRDEEACG
ncbi:hypothetical protein CYMTET_11487 [Cymbomonas tetramitiformis]|uniref:Uncharacterized protein n=1 Tax=Cymbomonas tetramitiformis TaxID=36881 RepID=A0AAE0GMG5_9CHLO|nr:hypothetical protein CYMTET_11487 [Cymbomonas tetramitiformis]